MTTATQLLAFWGTIIRSEVELRYASLNNLYYRQWGVVSFEAEGSVRLICKISKPTCLINTSKYDQLCQIGNKSWGY